MAYFAAASTALAKVQSIPTAVWLKIAAGILGLVLLVIVLRKVAKMNKIVLGVIVCLTLTFIGFNWIYERNEPGWATPVVEKLATFFPTKSMAR